MLFFSWWWLGWIHFLWVGRDEIVDAGWSWWLGLLVGSELDLVEVSLKEGIWCSGAEIKAFGMDWGLGEAWFLSGSPLCCCTITEP
eukprot:12223430-Ditylum_brightwellii.AAC.1